MGVGGEEGGKHPEGWGLLSPRRRWAETEPGEDQGGGRAASRP